MIASRKAPKKSILNNSQKKRLASVQQTLIRGSTKYVGTEKKNAELVEKSLIKQEKKQSRKLPADLANPQM